MQEQLTVQFILVLVTQSTLASVDYIQKMDGGQCNILKKPSQWYPRPVAIHVGHQCYPFVPDDGSSDNIYFPEQSDVCCSCDYDKPTMPPRPSSMWTESPIGTEIAEMPSTSALTSDRTSSEKFSEVYEPSTPSLGESSLQTPSGPAGWSPESSTLSSTEFLGASVSTPQNGGEGVQGHTSPESHLMGTESPTLAQEEASTMLQEGAVTPENGPFTIPTTIEGGSQTNLPSISIQYSTPTQEETSSELQVEAVTEPEKPGEFPDISSPSYSANTSVATSTSSEGILGPVNPLTNLTSTGMESTASATQSEMVGGFSENSFEGSTEIYDLLTTLPTSSQLNFSSTAVESSTLAQEETSSILTGGTQPEIPGELPEVSTHNSWEEPTQFLGNASFTTASSFEGVSDLLTPQSNATGITGPSQEELSTILPGGTQSVMPGSGFSENVLEGSTYYPGNELITTTPTSEQVSEVVAQSNSSSTSIESSAPTQPGIQEGRSTPSSLEGSSGFTENNSVTTLATSEGIFEPITPLSNLSSTGIESSTETLIAIGTEAPAGIPENTTTYPMGSETISSITTTSGSESNLYSTDTSIPEAGTESSNATQESTTIPGESSMDSTGESGSENTERPGTTLSIIDRIQKLIRDIEKNKCDKDE